MKPVALREKPYSRWYGTQAWRNRAKAQLAAEPLCRHCRARGHVVEAEIADHIEHHHGDAEKFWHGDLQSLCWGCHSSKTRDDEHARTGRPRLLKGCGPDGVPIDLRHHWHT
jgi:5-methylcytosine-specific restriction protein A